LKPNVPNRPTVNVVSSVVPHGPASAAEAVVSDELLLPPQPARANALIATTASRAAP
jgi:hypothetical protein